MPAHHLGIAQPSVTAHIRALENQVGAALFVRQRGRKLRPTMAGEALYTYARDAVDQAEAIHHTLKKVSGTKEQGFSMVSVRALGISMLPPVLASFLKRFPDVRISMYTESLEMTVELARSGKCDVAILLDTEDDEGVDSEVITSEPLAFIAAPNHPLAKCRNIEPSELQTYPFVAPLKDARFFELLKSKLVKFGMTEYPVILHLQDVVSVKQAVAHNVGLACTLRSVAREEIARGELVVLHVARQTPHLTVRCFSRPAPHLPEVAAQFVKHLKEQVRKT
jgi:DNA-binding transcriptional LysR family regulator